MADEKLLLDDIFLQPWFLSLKTANEIRVLLPTDHRHKMRFYFEDYGCLKCGKKGVRYGSNAMCKPCVQQVKLRFFGLSRGVGLTCRESVRAASRECLTH